MSMMRIQSRAVRRTVTSVLTGLVGVGLSGVPEASACGQGGPTLEQLLPQDGARDVPLNAVLILSSQGPEPELLLRRVRVSADATDELLPVDVSCRAAEDEERGWGALCFGRAALEPHTEYEWTAQGLPNFAPIRRRFTTGGSPAMEFPLEKARAELIEHGPLSNECGHFNYAVVEVDTLALERPVVATVGIPRFPNHAILIEPTKARTQIHLTDVEGCVDVELFDELGTSTSPNHFCFDGAPESDADPELDPADLGATDEPEGGSGAPRAIADGRGCSFAPHHRSPSAWLTALLLGLAIVRASVRRAYTLS